MGTAVDDRTMTSVTTTATSDLPEYLIGATLTPEGYYTNIKVRNIYIISGTGNERRKAEGGMWDG